MLVALLLPALAAPAPCLTPTLLPTLPGPVGVAGIAPPGATKGDRDAWGIYPNAMSSTNFIVKWGNSGGVSSGEVSDLLDSFEASWAAEIEDWGHPAPWGTDTYKFNVYIGDTGGGTPSSYGSGGYYYQDDDGYGYIVIAESSLRDAQYVEGTAAHEFYHALQDAVAVYGYGDGDPGAWYWEATASWAQGEVFPDNPTYAQFLMGYAWLPELSVAFFDYPDSGTLEEYHQYGAFIYPRFLTEFVADRQLIVDSWVDPGGARDPLEALEAGLGAGEMADSFGEFAARNAVWDYADGAIYRASIGDWRGWFDDDSPVAAEVGDDGTDGWITVAEDLWPQRYAYALVDLPDTEGGYTTRFDGEAEGTGGSPADWRVQVVLDDGGPTYLPVTLDADGVGAVEVPGGAFGYLVVAAVPDEATRGETFGFAYAVEVEEVEEAEDSGLPTPRSHDDEEEEGGGCGCASPGAPGAAWAAVALLLGIRRRRG